MTSSAGLAVAVVGLRFGEEFLPIYHRHPDVTRVGVCDTDPERLARVADRHGVRDRFDSLDEVLADERYAAVHLVSPVPRHARQTLQVLRSGRHCACAVPMATTLADLEEIIEAQRVAGTSYMMMETTLYGREYLYARALRDSGTLGRLSFLRGYHTQDLEGYPTYWWGFPPMHYATHALAPLLALADARATSVRCLGSGRLPERLIRDYDNVFPVETAQFRLDRDELAAEVTMSFFRTGRAYQEGFSVYGEHASFEWEQLRDEGPARFTVLERPPGRRGRPIDQQRVELPDHADLLPPEIRRFTRPGCYDPGTGQPYAVRGAHGGSHPHLVHEFVRSALEGRRSAIDTVRAARWTAPGICAHASAMREGEAQAVPHY
ncbi:Gfo/Idh/MocA family protein [Streptomyces oceani]|uniref:Oxidoreductase n=1 Tax=Streptomyces oceani TaxID=1075402 RepID=A0A1E7KQ42_9ACTN|nr:Gfo/Idh/MocA family oxidoreductase [Streptomyces oceani]OEV06036.1 oxidoreductase [Streptomyces oceani]